MIKIFAFPTHCTKTTTPGVDYVRMILPMQELAKNPNFYIEVYKNDKEVPYNWQDWQRIAEEFDILYINYLTLPWDFSLVGMLFRKYGKKIVFDIDDLIWEIQQDNSSYSVYAPGSEGRAVVTDICREVDYITCTNNYLKNGIGSYVGKSLDKIKVFPNYIDLDLYNWKEPPIKKAKIRIGYFGSSSHFNDLAEKEFSAGLEKLMSEYPNVEIVTIGAMLASWKKKFGMRYMNDFGHQDLFTWIKMFPDKIGEIDIFAVPLVDTTYCRAKSSIKFLEMSSTARPGCWQNIRQYQEVVQSGKNGFLCQFADEWYSSLKKLVDSEELRREMGQRAYQTVVDRWQMKDNIGKYVEFFTEIMKK